jgi:U1 small nuclear ribonucleoprotein C
MPKFYCDYCDIYLAHSSIGGRRQHCIGRKHIQNKIDHYQKIVRDQGHASFGMPAGMPPIGMVPPPPGMPPIGLVPPGVPLMGMAPIPPGMPPIPMMAPMGQPFFGMAPPPPMMGGFPFPVPGMDPATIAHAMKGHVIPPPAPRTGRN